MDRRRFLLTSAGLTVGGLFVPGLGLSCSSEGSGQEASPPDTPPGDDVVLERIGVQLYTVRSLLEEDFEGTLQQIADIGYDEVEFHNYFGREPEAVRALLDELGLSSPALHASLDALRNDLDGVLAAAQTIGHRYVVCPWLPNRERSPLAKYEALAVEFNRYGEACRDAGLQFAYHNHDFEFKPQDGILPYDVLIDQTDPELVQLELDLYWIAKAGYDPLDYFQRYPGRFTLCHVKDMADNGSITPVGQGTIDFAQIFAQAEQAGLRHYFVEHDNPEDPLESIRTSYQYLAE